MQPIAPQSFSTAWKSYIDGIGYIVSNFGRLVWLLLQCLMAWIVVSTILIKIFAYLGHPVTPSSKGFIIWDLVFFPWWHSAPNFFYYFGYFSTIGTPLELDFETMEHLARKGFPGVPSLSEIILFSFGWFAGTLWCVTPLILSLVRSVRQRTKLQTKYLLHLFSRDALILWVGLCATLLFCVLFTIVLNLLEVLVKALSPHSLQLLSDFMVLLLYPVVWLTCFSWLIFQYMRTGGFSLYNRPVFQAFQKQLIGTLKVYVIMFLISIIMLPPYLLFCLLFSLPVALVLFLFNTILNPLNNHISFGLTAGFLIPTSAAFIFITAPLAAFYRTNLNSRKKKT